MRKWIAPILCICLLAACCVPALAATDAKYADALNALGLFRGTDKGYELEKSLTREQGVVMIIRLLGAEKDALACKEAHPFTDLTNYAWFAPYAAYAYSKGITRGVSATAFGYGSGMTEAMFLTMLLRVLGYEDANDGSKDFVWSDPFTLAKTLKIAETPIAGAFTREAMTERCWNTLSARFKEENKTLAEKLIADSVFPEEKWDETKAKLSGGTGTGAASSGSTGTTQPSSTRPGGSSSGAGAGDSYKPVKPNETPRLPMP